LKTIQEAGGKAIAIRANATDTAAVSAAIQKIAVSLSRIDLPPKNFEDSIVDEQATPG
jgi:hypothetical protein